MDTEIFEQKVNLKNNNENIGPNDTPRRNLKLKDRNRNRNSLEREREVMQKETERKNERKNFFC